MWTITRRTHIRHERPGGRGYHAESPRRGVITTTYDAGTEPDSEEVKAYRLAKNPDTLRAYHLDRVTRKFNSVISAENAELLAGLLGSDSGEGQDVA
jgi:hypothetical protein